MIFLDGFTKDNKSRARMANAKCHFLRRLLKNYKIFLISVFTGLLFVFIY